jgi:hypothetical protein
MNSLMTVEFKKKKQTHNTKREHKKTPLRRGEQISGIR